MSEAIRTSQLFKSSAHHAHPFTCSYKVNNGNQDVIKTAELRTRLKVKAIVTAIFVTLLTLPLLIVGGLALGYLAFSLSAARSKAKMIKHEMKKPLPALPAPLPPAPPIAPAPISPKETAQKEFNTLAHKKLQLNEERTQLETQLHKQQQDNPGQSAETSEQIRKLQERIEHLTKEISDADIELDRLEAVINGTSDSAARHRANLRKLQAEKKKQQQLAAAAAKKAAREEAERKAAARRGELVDRYIDFMTATGTTPEEMEAVAKQVLLHRPPVKIPGEGDPLPPIPAVPGLIGINNPSATTCWLNSLLKFLAYSPMGDNICNAQTDFPEAQQIQATLRTIISCLRTGGNGRVIDYKLINKFLEDIAPLMPPGTLPINGNHNVKQQDAAELLQQLNSLFGVGDTSVSSADPRVLATHVRANQLYFPDERARKEGHYKEETRERYAENLRLKCAAKHLDRNQLNNGDESIPEYGSEININDCISEAERIKELRPDRVLVDGKLVDADLREYIVADRAARLVHLPPSLTVVIDRIVVPEDQRPGEAGVWCGPKSKSDIVLDPYKDDPFTIKIDEYKDEVQFNAGRGEFTVDKAHACHYAVKGAVVHQGSGSDGGHYIYLNRIAPGRYVYHSDSQVYEISEEDAGAFLRQASLLSLELIEKTAPENVPAKGTAHVGAQLPSTCRAEVAKSQPEHQHPSVAAI